MSSANPIDGFRVEPSTLSFVGHDLQRPECILAEPDGSLWTADSRGGVVHIRPDGSQRLIVPADPNSPSQNAGAGSLVSGTLPNGLALTRNGDILIANFGADRLELITRNGELRVLADQIDGQPIGKVNFVLRDSQDRLWLTISTRIGNWVQAMTPRIRDGYIALYDRGQIRIVADGLAFANEIRLDAREQWLYVAETTGRRVTRFRVAPDGGLSHRETFGPSDHAAFIDGIAFDSFGNLWGTHVMTDRVFAITPDGDLRIILDDDHDSARGRALIEAFHRDALTGEMLFACCGSIAPFFTSVTFGSPDLSTVYIGSLGASRIPAFRSPLPGLPMAHWPSVHPPATGKSPLA